MSFLNELKTAYQDAQKSKLWTDEIKQAIAERAKSGDSQYTHYFCKQMYTQNEINSLVKTAHSESLDVQVLDHMSCGNEYYEVTISGWAE